ncbi:hypothetical protein PHISP_02866, partial [Aspergillus sp. HF37]
MPNPLYRQHDPAQSEMRKLPPSSAMGMPPGTNFSYRGFPQMMSREHVGQPEQFKDPYMGMQMRNMSMANYRPLNSIAPHLGPMHMSPTMERMQAREGSGSAASSPMLAPGQLPPGQPTPQPSHQPSPYQQYQQLQYIQHGLPRLHQSQHPQQAHNNNRRISTTPSSRTSRSINDSINLYISHTILTSISNSINHSISVSISLSNRRNRRMSNNTIISINRSNTLNHNS